jgi:uncharacterized protein YqjF (DUF2071 family)
MVWRELLFAHWAVSPDSLRAIVPRELELDLIDNRAWLAVTPFRMDLKLRAVPLLLNTPELNVRTYVTVNGKPGVYFFSLDLESRIGVIGAHAGFGLPYHFAYADVRRDDRQITYKLWRAIGRAEFSGSYNPTLPPTVSAPGTLEHFLTERYCLYNVEARRVFRSEIHHVPWLLHKAEATLERNTLPEAVGIKLPDTEPLTHYAEELEVLAWLPERVR